MLRQRNGNSNLNFMQVPCLTTLCESMMYIGIALIGVGIKPSFFQVQRLMLTGAITFHLLQARLTTWYMCVKLGKTDLLKLLQGIRFDLAFYLSLFYLKTSRPLLKWYCNLFCFSPSSRVVKFVVWGVSNSISAEVPNSKMVRVWSGNPILWFQLTAFLPILWYY